METPETESVTATDTEILRGAEQNAIGVTVGSSDPRQPAKVPSAASAQANAVRTSPDWLDILLSQPCEGVKSHIRRWGWVPTPS